MHKAVKRLWCPTTERNETMNNPNSIGEGIDVILTDNRWMQKVNAEVEDFHELVKPVQPEVLQNETGSPGIKTNTEKEAD